MSRTFALMYLGDSRGRIRKIFNPDTEIFSFMSESTLGARHLPERTGQYDKYGILGWHDTFEQASESLEGWAHKCHYLNRRKNWPLTREMSHKSGFQTVTGSIQVEMPFGSAFLGPNREFLGCFGDRLVAGKVAQGVIMLREAEEKSARS